DAGTGQNALNQMHEFNKAVGITGLALTKLDGTAKGGVAFALSRRFKVPLRYVGLGEGVDDLQVFRAEDYVKAVLSDVDDGL
ncbi:MAG: signal recognition particle-docking protein FtsY, partial [Gammaproteobacteria bacterium]